MRQVGRRAAYGVADQPYLVASSQPHVDVPTGGEGAPGRWENREVVLVHKRHAARITHEHLPAPELRLDGRVGLVSGLLARPEKVGGHLFSVRVPDWLEPLDRSLDVSLGVVGRGGDRGHWFPKSREQRTPPPELANLPGQ